MLEALGVRDLIAPEECAPIDGIRYVQEDGCRAEGALPAPGGLGIRRTALAAALARRAAGVRRRAALGVRGGGLRERPEARSRCARTRAS